jgi:hypothetical protein
MIPVTPECFGTAPEELPTEVGELVGIGLVVIPMPPNNVKSPEDARSAHLEIDANRNQAGMSSVEMDPLITRLLPQLKLLDPSHPKDPTKAPEISELKRKRLLMATTPPAQPVTCRMERDLGEGIKPGRRGTAAPDDRL